MHNKVFVSPLNTSGGDEKAIGSASVCDEIVVTALRNCVRYCLILKIQTSNFIFNNAQIVLTICSF